MGHDFETAHSSSWMASYHNSTLRHSSRPAPRSPARMSKEFLARIMVKNSSTKADTNCECKDGGSALSLLPPLAGPRPESYRPPPPPSGNRTG